MKLLDIERYRPNVSLICASSSVGKSKCLRQISLMKNFGRLLARIVLKIKAAVFRRSRAEKFLKKKLEPFHLRNLEKSMELVIKRLLNGVLVIIYHLKNQK